MSAVAPMLGALRAGAMFAEERVAEFALPVPGDIRKRLATGWLLLALAALVGSGLFSVLLVLARTPGLQQMFPVADFFRVALVVHVDLSVLVWFAAFAGMLWTLNSRPRFAALAGAALALAAIGAIVMAAAPFLGQGRAIMSNYVPVLDDGVFLYGLTLFGIGFGLLVARNLLAPARFGAGLDGEGALRFGLNASVAAAAIALIALAWSWAEVPAELAGKPYY